MAKTTANKAKTCHIWLLDGTYTAQLVLDTTDSRTASAPLYVHSLNPKKAVFSPIVPVKGTDVKPIPDSVKDRIIDSVAKTKVRQVSLAAYNMPYLSGWPSQFGYPVNISATTSTRQYWPIVYHNTTPLRMSQYPNNGTMAIKRVLTNGTGGQKPGGSFVYRDDRIKYWGEAIKKGLWLRGNWRVDWQIDFVKTDSVDLVDSIVYQNIGVQGGIGNKYTRPAGNGKEPYVAVNLVEEIDTVGEWAIDFSNKMLYIYPPDTINLNLSGTFTPCISISRANNINLENIAIDGGSGDGVRLFKCNNINVLGMSIEHVSGYGVFVADGLNCMVKSNDIHDVGEGGVFLINSNFANDQFTLTPCNHKVINNHIYDYAKEVFLYAAAVDTRSAIGTYTAFNRIHGCPHVGILFGGNNNMMEYNDISAVVGKYTDMGAFYTAEAMTERGDTVRRNYIHDMAYMGSGLYADNNASGHAYHGNITSRCFYGSQNNFGLFDRFESNIYYDNYNAQHTNATAKLDTTATNTNFTRLKTLYYASSTYRNAYPELTDFFDTVNYQYASKMWPTLTGNVFLGTSVTKFCLNGVADNSLFQASGNTNNTYAPTVPFTKNGVVFASNFLAKTSLIKTGQATFLDTLKATKLFAKTVNIDWHISRLGLFKDSVYRPDIAQDKTQGAAPTFSIKATAKHGFVQNDTVTVTVTAYNPNMSKCYSDLKLYDNGTVTGLVAKIVKANFDSVQYTFTMLKPALGRHAVVSHLLDSTLWDFPSDSIVFNITAPLALKNNELWGKAEGCQARLAWTVLTAHQKARLEKNIGQGFLGMDGISLSGESTVLLQQAESIATYRLAIENGEGETAYSNAIAVKTHCDARATITPNPVQKGATAGLQCENKLSISATYQFRLQDAVGRTVSFQSHRLRPGENNIALNVKNLAPGTYWLSSELFPKALVMEIR